MAKDNQEESSSEERKTPSRLTGPGLMVPLLLVALIAGYLFVLSTGPKRIRFDVFKKQLELKNVEEVELFSRYAVGKFKQPPVLAGQPKQGEPEASKAERESPDEKSTPAKGKEPAKPDLSFMVTLPERINDNSEFTKLLEDSGAKY